MPRHLVLLFSITAMVLLPAVASAGTVRWVLHDVVFTDGTQATGYFEYDAAAHTFGRFHLDTIDGPITPGHSYTSNSATVSRAVFNNNPSGVNTNKFALTGTSWRLRLTPVVELDDSGGQHDLNVSFGDGNVECNNCGSYREISSGYLLGITDTIFANGFDD